MALDWSHWDGSLGSSTVSRLWVGVHTAHEQRQTQQQQERHRYGNLTPSPCTSMQHLPDMQHHKEVSLMQKHAPTVSVNFNDHMVL